jgi:excisionase family DNA binding protein
MAEADLISISDAAELVGVHKDTLFRLARTGNFEPAIRVGRQWRVSVPRLERFLHGELAAG